MVIYLFYLLSQVFCCGILCVRVIKLGKRVAQVAYTGIWAGAFVFLADASFNYYNYCHAHGLQVSFVAAIVMLAISLGGCFFIFFRNRFFSYSADFSANNRWGAIRSLTNAALPAVILVLTKILVGGTWKAASFIPLFFSVIWGPLFEELAFRWFVPRMLGSLGGRLRWLCYIIFSLEFAWLHVFDHYSLILFLVSFLFSAYCYYLREKTNRFYYLLLCHSLYNAMVLL